MYYRLKSLSEIEKGIHNYLLKDKNGNITDIKFYQCNISIELYNELRESWHNEEEFEKYGKYYFRYKDAIINKYYFEEKEQIFKDGDKVRIKTKNEIKEYSYEKKNNSYYKDHEEVHFTEGMFQYCNNEFYIKKNIWNSYCLYRDKELKKQISFYWDDWMFKKIKEEKLKWYKIKTKKQLEKCGYDFEDDELYISSLKGKIISADDITMMFDSAVYGSDVFSYFREITIDDFIKRGKTYEEMKEKYPDMVEGNTISKLNITKDTLVRLKPITEENKEMYNLAKLDLLEEFTNWHKVEEIKGSYIGVKIFDKIYLLKIKDCWFRNIVLVKEKPPILINGIDEDLKADIKEWAEKEKRKIKQEYKEKKMDLKERGIVMFNANKSSFKNAAKLEVGNAAISQATSVVKKKLPKGMRKYADNPLIEVAVANVFAMAIQQFAARNEKANLLSDAMMDAAALKFVQSFDIPGIVDDFIKSVNVDKLMDEKK